MELVITFITLMNQNLFYEEFRWSEKLNVVFYYLNFVFCNDWEALSFKFVHPSFLRSHRQDKTTGLKKPENTEYKVSDWWPILLHTCSCSPHPATLKLSLSSSSSSSSKLNITTRHQTVFSPLTDPHCIVTRKCYLSERNIQVWQFSIIKFSKSDLQIRPAISVLANIFWYCE